MPSNKECIKWDQQQIGHGKETVNLKIGHIETLHAFTKKAENMRTVLKHKTQITGTQGVENRKKKMEQKKCLN